MLPDVIDVGFLCGYLYRNVPEKAGSEGWMLGWVGAIGWWIVACERSGPWCSLWWSIEDGFNCVARIAAALIYSATPSKHGM